MTKSEIAGILENIAALLELKGENPFKIRAYTNAARAIETFGAQRSGSSGRRSGGENSGDWEKHCHQNQRACWYWLSEIPRRFACAISGGHSGIVLDSRSGCEKDQSPL